MFSSPQRIEDSRAASSLVGRDVIMLVADALAAKHLGCYGYDRDTSPVIDRLAAEGAMFTAASSQTSWTLPSVVTLFTSQEQERHGILHLDQHLDNRLTTLAELYSASGYRTLGLVQNGVIQSSTGVNRGFDRYRTYGWDEDGVAGLVEDVRSEFAAPNRKPIFLYVHLLPPHAPYEPPKELAAPFVDPDYDGPIDGQLRSLQALIKQRPSPEDSDVLHLVGLYDGYVRFADAVMGQVLQLFADQPLREGPLVVVTADHGEAFFEHGAQGHNRNIYQEMIHVPLIFWRPGSDWSPGTVVDFPVSLLDVLPSLQDLFQLGETRQSPQGVSLASFLEAGEKTESLSTRPLFLTSRHSKKYPAFHQGVRLGPHKLVRQARVDGTVVERLFDLNRDPVEQDNLALQHPVRRAAMASLLDAWWDEVNADGLKQEQAELDAERTKAIEKIGYTGDDG